MKRRIAIVTPWYGPECTGGAERKAAESAERLARYHDVTILTTTSRAFVHDWDVDYFKPGTTRDDAYEVERFRVAPRDRGLFNDANQDLLGTPPERWRRDQREPQAFRYLHRRIDQLAGSRAPPSSIVDAAFTIQSCFIPYLYGVVVRGIEEVFWEGSP